MRYKIFIWIVVGIFLISSVFAISDISVFQGQYHNETSFIQGIFEFTFDIYDAGVGGNFLGSYKENLTTGSWGQWKVEIPGVSAVCNDSSKDYFMEITIDNNIQTPRRRLTQFNYLRKDINEKTIGNLQVSGVIKGDSSPQFFEGIEFVNALDKPKFTLYHSMYGENFTHVPEAFDDSLIFEVVDSKNTNAMAICFWDEARQTMFGCLNEGAMRRATTWRKSMQIIGNKDTKSDDENFTLCEGYNYIDCLTDVTGADLGVQDDIEALGSIYTNENITANYYCDSTNCYELTEFLNAPLNYTNLVLTNQSNTFTEDQTIQGNLTIRDKLIFELGEIIDNLVDGWIKITGSLLVSEDVNIEGNLDVAGNISFGGKAVCLEDGTNCPVNSNTNCSVDGSCSNIVYESELNYTIDTDTSASTECSNDEVLLGNGSCVSLSGFGGGGGNGGISGAPVRFISTVDGKLNRNDRYLSLGTGGGIGASVTTMAWIIDRDMTITGILWDSQSNSRTKTSAITLMSGSNKNSLSDTSLSKDIQGVVSGSDLTFSVSLSQGDVVAIKYDSGGSGGDVEDLSITLIGIYD